MKKIIITILISIIFIFSLLLTGCVELEKLVDPCKEDYEECKYSCGDGWLSGLCKADCSDRYNTCKNH